MLDNVNFTSYAVVDGEKKYFKDQYGREESENRDSVLQAQIGEARESKINIYDTFAIGSRIIKANRLKEASYSRDNILKINKYYYTQNNTYQWIQSAVYVDSLDHIILGFTNADYTIGMLVEVEKDFKTVVKRVGDLNIGHVNDLTYNPNTDKIYVAPMDTGTNNNKIIEINPSTLAISRVFSIDKTVYQISYDRKNNVYYVGSTNIEIYDENFNLMKSIPFGSIPNIDDTDQGSHCKDGNFIVISQNDEKSYLRTFDLNTGNVAQYHAYDNRSYYEEIETLIEFDGDMYSISGQTNIYITRYNTRESSSNSITGGVYYTGKKITAYDDLNDYLLEGKYYSPYGSYTQTLSNIPANLNSGFSLYVLNQGQDWMVQILVENSNRKKIYFRTYNSGSFGVWVRNHSGFPTGDELATDADLNFFTEEGKFYSESWAKAQGISHLPTECGSGFSLYVVAQGKDWKVQILVENSNRKKIYFRTYNSGTWGTWRLKNKESVSSSAIALNGTYQIPSEMLDYDALTISCNRNYYFGSVTISVKAIKSGDVANGTICVSDLSHYWTFTIDSTGLLTLTSKTGVADPYIRVIAN